MAAAPKVFNKLSILLVGETLKSLGAAETFFNTKSIDYSL